MAALYIRDKARRYIACKRDRVTYRVACPDILVVLIRQPEAEMRGYL